MKVNEIDTIKNLLKEYFSGHPEIEIGYVFGSVAQGRDNPLSDIDVAVFIDKDKVDESRYSYGYNAQVTADLMKLLKRNDIDFIVLNNAPFLLRHRVIYSGKLVFCRDERKRSAFQVETLNKYNDLKFLKNCAH